MNFSKKQTATYKDLKPTTVKKSATKIPLTVIGIVAVLPIFLLLTFTLKSGYTPSNKKGTFSKMVVQKTSAEIAESATVALQKKDTDLFLEILNRDVGNNLNMVNSKGDTLLMVASTLGNLEAAQQLILAGADVNITNTFTRDTALIRSLLFGNNVELTRMLIYNGADINVKNRYNQSPLHIALDKKLIELVDLFLTSGISEGLTTDYLFESCAKKNEVGVLAMLKGGINPNTQNDKGNTPLMISASLGDLASVQELLSYRADLNAQNKSGNTALIYAARYQHPAVIQELLKPQTMQLPVDIDAQNKNGQTALYWAAAMGNEEITRRLLAADADPSLATITGETPRDVAEKNNKQNVLAWFDKDLIEVKNSVIEQDNKELIAQGKAPVETLKKDQVLKDEDLFTAAKEGNIELAQKVLNNEETKGAITAKDKEGNTPLMVAVANGQIEIVDLLTENEARLFEKGKDGNILHIAVKSQNIDMLKHVVQLTKQRMYYNNMIEINANIEGQQYPLTPLGLAASMCYKEGYQLLLNNGAKPGQKTKEGSIVLKPSPVDLWEKCKAAPATAKTLSNTSKKKNK